MPLEFRLEINDVGPARAGPCGKPGSADDLRLDYDKREPDSCEEISGAGAAAPFS
jgi:hypothetical protein